jgi:hypothetical protein
MWGGVSAWTKPTSSSIALGNIYTGRLTVIVTRLNFCSPPDETWPQHGVFFERAIGQHDLPESITIDKSGANTAAINGVIADTGVDILMRQCKCLNNIVEQDHTAIKRVTRPMMGFKNFQCAQSLGAGIETMHMIRKGQMKSGPEGYGLSKAEQFYSLAF